MDRVAYNAMLAQYATPEVSGNGRVSWDKGVRCVMPSVKLYGKCEQGTLTGKNLFNVDWIVEQINAGNFATDGVAYEKTVEIPIENGTYVLSVHNRISDKGTCILSVNKAVNSTSSGAVGLSPTFSDYNAVTVENGALYIGCNSSVENFIYLIQNCMVQIEVGGKLTAYEPYCGGIPAPNPSYPMPIRCNNGVFRATDATGDYDGGQATAPELMVAVDGSCQSTYDPQTGKLVDWWWPEIVFDGSEDEKWVAYTSTSFVGFRTGITALPEKMSRNAYWCNMLMPLAKQFTSTKPHLWCGVNTPVLFALASPTVGFPFYDETLDDFGLANWKAHLAENPMRVRVARNNPLVTYTEPQKLTQPPGSGQIIQLSGDVADCLIMAKYLTHS